MLSVNWRMSMHRTSPPDFTGILFKLFFRQTLPGLPTDLRALSGSPRQKPKIPVGSCDYVRFGLYQCLKRTMDSSTMLATDKMAIQLHVGSLILFHESLQRLWLIFGRVRNPLSRVFVVDLYYGMA
ncbi:hypothetical protein FGIG_07960 [Fasciola gigantica]|uniref:Uncharacterized protein n=1 Tax=Fasciola gigantica TaxID=46835 RepID=A0A504YD85_FASGI|nr:hypothetical protein FGIG_07960 [Fasciola gigantica]